jgi:hypothetical protein
VGIIIARTRKDGATADTAQVIDRYIEESENAVVTKAQVLKAITLSDPGDLKCSEVTAQTLVAFGKGQIYCPEKQRLRPASDDPIARLQMNNFHFLLSILIISFILLMNMLH